MKKVVTEKEVKDAYKSGKKELEVSSGTIITPLAKDTIKQFGMRIVEPKSNEKIKHSVNKISIGSDHTGYALKEILKKILTAKSYNIIDVGTNNEQSCDYPDFAVAVAQKVISREADFGIMIDATGIPSAITANKIPGIRAATCYNEFSAWSARNHNNANLLVMGAKTIGEETAKSILEKWLATGVEGGRHQKRLDKITFLENRLFNSGKGT